jgi:hypothetical protein
LSTSQCIPLLSIRSNSDTSRLYSSASLYTDVEGRSCRWSPVSSNTPYCNCYRTFYVWYLMKQLHKCLNPHRKRTRKTFNSIFLCSFNINNEPLYVRCTKLTPSALKIKISIIFSGNVGNEGLWFARLALFVHLAVP